VVELQVSSDPEPPKLLGNGSRKVTTALVTARKETRPQNVKHT
jgi:hypothetical protein